MRKIFVLLGCYLSFQGIGQDTTIVSNAAADSAAIGRHRQEIQPTHIFFDTRLINANTVQLIPKGILEFKVSHSFEDAAGSNGGLKNFFGLDNAVDVRIGFQYGLSRRINIAAARYKGSGLITRIYELGVKWLVLQQADNDPGRPVSLALYGNAAVATMKSGTDPNLESFADGFSDRLSNMAQLMLARKFGKISLQLSPTLVHRNRVLNHDQPTLFALGGAARIHLGGRYSLLLDYFHTFRNKSSIDSFKARNIRFHDVLGVGFEILTGGHVFHINFTNATDILENKFIPRTVESWGKGEFRWGFSISRDFDLLYKKKNRKK